MKYSVWLFWNRIRDWDFAAATRIAWEQLRYLLFRSRCFSVFCWDSQTLTGESLISEKFRVDQVTSWNSLTNAERKQICLVQSNADQFFDQGAELWIGRYHGKLAVIVWTWSYPSIHSWFFPVLSGSAVFNHCFTFPEFRGLGLYPTALKEVARKKTEQGFKHLYVHCFKWHDHSIRGIKKAGFVFMGSGWQKKNHDLLWDPESGIVDKANSKER